jgi:hypothetical protein
MRKNEVGKEEMSGGALKFVKERFSTPFFNEKANYLAKNCGELKIPCHYF